MFGKLRSIAILVIGMLVISFLAFAEEDRGADQISLFGGTRGEVPFPHYLHQNKLEDCKICHDTFPQESGAIEKMKADGQLKKKHVMNKLCTKCHREKKSAGEKTGPITCKQCHIKDK